MTLSKTAGSLYGCLLEKFSRVKPGSMLRISSTVVLALSVRPDAARAAANIRCTSRFSGASAIALVAAYVASSRLPTR